MKARTLSIVALVTALGIAIALTLERGAPQRVDAAASVPSGTAEVDAVEAVDVQEAERLVADHEQAREESLKNEARDDALARAREEQQEQWQGLRRDQVFTAPMEQALQDAQVVPDAVELPSSEAR
jgi:hypothetical protein